jgi:Mycothiol maleylpyruvate isomerase N-terminal domain
MMRSDSSAREIGDDMSHRPVSDAIELLEAGHARVTRAIAGLSPAQLERPATIGGGAWSARDLLSHLTSWDRHALEALEAWRDRQVAPIDRALRRQSLAAVNEAALEADRPRSLAAVRRAFDETHGRLVEELRATSPEEWEAPPTPRKRRAMADLIGAILGGPAGPFEHVSAHLPDLEAYVAAVRETPGRSRREG